MKASVPSPSSDRASLFVLSVFGCGFGPLVPGTYGSLAGLAIALLVPTGSWTTGILAGVVASSALTVLLAPGAIRATGRKDPQQVVMDEVAGMMLASRETCPVSVSWPGMMMMFGEVQITLKSVSNLMRYPSPSSVRVAVPVDPPA